MLAAEWYDVAGGVGGVIAVVAALLAATRVVYRWRYPLGVARGRWSTAPLRDTDQYVTIVSYMVRNRMTEAITPTVRLIEVPLYRRLLMWWWANSNRTWSDVPASLVRSSPSVAPGTDAEVVFQIEDRIGRNVQAFASSGRRASGGHLRKQRKGLLTTE
jgi:hypothetical protein